MSKTTFSPRFLWKIFADIDTQAPCAKFTSDDVKKLLDEIAEAADGEIIDRSGKNCVVTAVKPEDIDL